MTGNHEENWLEENFPLGDGTADTTAAARCPYCGERVELSLDPGGGDVQEYVEDCEVCCRPWRVAVRYKANGRARVMLSSQDE